MKRLSEFTTALLQRFFGGSLSDEPDKLKMIAEIAAEEETASILPLSRLLTDESPLVRHAAADAVGHLVALCRPEELAGLDEEMRYYLDWHARRKWDRFRKQDVDKLPSPKTAQAAVLGLASFHRSGHVRERAVELLDSIQDGSELPFLLIRLNDWVDAVRERARLAVERRLHGDAFEAFITNIALVFRLLQQQRADHGPLVQAVVRELVQPEHEAALPDIVQSENRSVRRRAFQAASELPGPHQVRLAGECIRSSDPVIRLWSVRLANSVLDGGELAAYLRQSEGDTFMPVRREVLRARVESFPGECEDALTAALFDRSPAMREEARYHLRKQGQHNFAEVYRRAISEDSLLDRAIAGLGETGDSTDTTLVLPFLQSDLTRVRLAAVIAIGRMGADAHAEAIIEHLADESPRVAREAAKALRECSSRIGKHRLWTLFCSDERGHVRMAVLRLLDGLGSWEKLPYMIRAAADSDERIAERAMISAGRLYNRVFTTPSEQQRQEIKQSIEATAGKLPSSFETLVRTWLCR